MAQRTIRMIIDQQTLVTATASMNVREAARLMKEHRVGAVMVVEDDKLVGIFTERDAAFRVLAEGLDGTALLSDTMTRNPQTLHPDKLFTHALDIMYRGGFRHVPVVEEGRPVGIVSARDALGPELEAFVYELLRQEQVDEVLA